MWCELVAPWVDRALKTTPGGPGAASRRRAPAYAEDPLALRRVGLSSSARDHVRAGSDRQASPAVGEALPSLAGQHEHVPEERSRLPVAWTRAQGPENRVLAAADMAIGLGSGAIGFARSLMRRGQPLLAPVVAPATGIARTAVSIAERTGLPAQLRNAAERGRRERVALTSAASRGVLGLVPEVTGALLDQIDLTVLVAERVDLNAVVGKLDIERVLDRVDMDDVATRIDVDAIVERIDVAGLARYIIEELDLPELIRSSMGSITSDTVRGMRMQSIAADDLLGRVVDRALLRRRPRPTEVPSGDGNAGDARSDDERREPHT